jgi:hypothetical protein
MSLAASGGATIGPIVATAFVDASGRLVLDGEGRPQVSEPSGRTFNTLEPTAADWLMQDVKNPARRRVLFQAEPQATE